MQQVDRTRKPYRAPVLSKGPQLLDVTAVGPKSPPEE
jgi:hypothetical protein